MNRRDFIAGAVGGLIVGGGAGFAFGKGKAKPASAPAAGSMATAPAGAATDCPPAAGGGETTP